MLFSRLVARMFLLGLMVVCSGLVSGQSYPNKSIRIVTSGAGGSSDLGARIIAQEITGPLGQPLIVDNQADRVGPEMVAKAAPDGYTILMGGSVIWLTPFMYDSVPWDAMRDFSPITLVERSPNILVVHPTVAANSVKELIALARAKPGELNFASGSIGGASHLAGELFKSMTGTKIVWVAYKGSSAAAVGLTSGEVQMGFGSGSLVPHVKSGKLRVLATTGTRPSTLFPGLPTVAESGLPGFAVESLDVILAPAKTPPAIITRLNQEIVRVLNKPDIKAKLLSIGTEVASSTPEELAATIKSESAKWSKLIKEVGIRPN